MHMVPKIDPGINPSAAKKPNSENGITPTTNISQPARQVDMDKKKQNLTACHIIFYNLNCKIAK